MFCLPLVSRGVVSGLCLVAAKYWYDRYVERQGLKAASGNGTFESKFEHMEHPQASSTVMNVHHSAPAVSGAEAIAATEAQSGVIGTGDRHAAAPEAASGEAVDTIATPGPQVPDTAATADPLKDIPRRKLDDDQRVEEALACGDLASMDTLLEDICDPVHRHRLLNHLVAKHYQLRTDLKHRAAFYRFADLQIEETASILDGIEEIGRPRPEHIEAFKSMAIALDEDGCQDSAIAICKLALSLGLQDGTKSGFEGRIRKLQKSRMRVGAARPKNMLH